MAIVACKRSAIKAVAVVVGPLAPVSLWSSPPASEVALPLLLGSFDFDIDEFITFCSIHIMPFF